MRNRLKISVLLLFVLMFVLSCLYTFYLISLIFGRSESRASNLKSCSHHVLILGESEDENFLSSIYDGASSVSTAYDCVVELYVPKSYSSDKSLQSLFNYASFINPDGIIACIPETRESLEFPHDRKGELIPLVTLAQYHPDMPQISFIGTNYSELGRKIALESADCLSDSGTVVIINTDGDSSPNYSTLMNSLTNTLSSHSQIRTEVLDFTDSEKNGSYNSLVKSMIIQKNANLLVCLNPEDTIRIAQLVTEINKDGQIKIIGLGSGEVLDNYLNRGTITELISIDSEKIGQMAMKEIFEYIRNGYSNNYISAGVRVKRSGKK